ncbi:MAG: GTP-binding protein [Gammaproteobacteria bacterium]|nr:GTP-binding protein [Gammaproteobacteria bacterium]MBQ0838486.1 GTP-binding protein [Gammaproteobacteria bacterium]
MIPVTVITGFLGSGKTTLISRLLQSPDLADTAVIVNEFGETDLDHTLIAASSENILQLMNGCICCTIREDLALELRNLFHLRTLGDVPRFNRVLIETTGLADPVPIVHTLMANSELRKAYRMQAVVTLVDALAGERTLADQDVSRRQVALADELLIAKTDLADEQALASLREVLADINPSANVQVARDLSVADLLPTLSSDNHYPLKGRSDDIEQWLGAGQGDGHSSDHASASASASASGHGTGHGSGILTFTLYPEQAFRLADLILFFQELVNYQPDKLLRVKALVAVEGKLGTPAVVHCIRDKVYPLIWLDNWPGGEAQNQLVFITDGIVQSEIETILKTVCSN